MKACRSPIAFETLVAYWAGDLDATQADAVEVHVFSCATCTKTSERIAAIGERIRGLEPAMIAPERVAQLRAAGRRVEDRFIAPGERISAVFDEQEFLVFHLGGLDLRDVDRVGIVVTDDATGTVLTENPSAPYDAENGEVLIACQQHFAAFPRNVAFEVTAFAKSGEKKSARYVAVHHFTATDRAQ